MGRGADGADFRGFFEVGTCLAAVCEDFRGFFWGEWGIYVGLVVIGKDIVLIYLFKYKRY